MEYEIVWGGDPEDVTVVTAGEVTIEALHSFVQELLSDPRYHPALRVLLDHRKADWSKLTSDDLRRRVDLALQDADRLVGLRAAWVGGRAVDYGMARMMESIDAGRIGMTFRVFGDIDEARAWLRGAE